MRAAPSGGTKNRRKDATKVSEIDLKPASATSPGGNARRTAGMGRAQGIKGLDSVLTGQLTREEIGKDEVDSDYQLKLLDCFRQVHVGN
jgi:Protein of unknown function (DUF1013)